MEIYTSPLETSLTLQPRNSFRDVSFSSYLNTAEENTIRKLTNQPNRKKPEDDDEEIGVFGAEKYFKGEIEDENSKNNNRRFVDPSNNNTTKIHHQDHGIEEFDHSFHLKQKTDQTDQISIHTPSVRSNASLNSRSGLLPTAKEASRRIQKGSKTRILLASFGCNCINRKSTQISEKTNEISKLQSRMFDFDRRAESMEKKNARNDCFSFPVLNDSNSNSISSLNSRSGNLARKADIPIDDEICVPSNGMYNNDHDYIDSDSSSDLFEIESFSTTGNSSFLAHRTSESNCYAPSEVSVDWSVVTASAADFSVASDCEAPVSATGGGGGGWRNSGRKEEQKRRNGMLSGCTNHKAVRVAGDEYKVSGGGGGGGRRRSSESMAVGSVFRGVKSVTRFDRKYGSDECPMTEPKLGHALQHLYIQQ
ncbi:hypothetical protein OSB04_018409 [Centaurea solstitialis]|uniref:Uncharacterized protein n=1 Tax=Centaurea solstitialis TaxID=347529 RepID=A0AA38T6H1_9ASTR|nr:hypothetical protein OSB04_018409 [Centaurea solstitialis]